ncbi:DapH/DapD/GlmU-related protein [Mycobacterium sp. DL440]|uniref:DapH/DapD/GlmU-related protein n=1 Tax=Mycobacterium sp. DL440 TaxID=2675523 RepID=UPI00142026EE|nr:DapH/DapD/GlmU-related protein [Mycobacterium sp. DL440]
MPSSEPPSTGNEFSLSGFTGQGYDRGRSLPVQIIWLVVSRSVLFRWWMPNRVRIAVLRAFGARVGAGALIRHGVRIHWPWKLEVGECSWIGEGAWILNLENVTIGSNSCVSQDVLLCTGGHDRYSPTFEFDNGPIVIGDRVWVAARATVLRGVRIGDGATIAATALVSQDVPAGGTVFPPRSTKGAACG